MLSQYTAQIPLFTKITSVFNDVDFLKALSARLSPTSGCECKNVAIAKLYLHALQGELVALSINRFGGVVTNSYFTYLQSVSEETNFLLSVDKMRAFCRRLQDLMLLYPTTDGGKTVATPELFGVVTDDFVSAHWPKLVVTAKMLLEAIAASN